MRQTQRTAGNRNELANVFLRRSIRMLERVTATASPDALESALASPTDVGGVASLLSDLAPLGVEVSSVDPLVESIARGALVKQELMQQAGGGLTSSQVARALGITRQAVEKRRSRRALLAVSANSGDYLYPACQFTPEGVLSGLGRVLQAFDAADPWTMLSAMMSPLSGLGGKSILDELKVGDINKAIAIASAFGEQGG